MKIFIIYVYTDASERRCVGAHCTPKVKNLDLGSTHYNKCTPIHFLYNPLSPMHTRFLTG